jgi:polar amino acid transport system substrate-binding protein
MTKHLARVCVPALAVLALAGCGSSNNSSTSTTSTTTTPSSGANASIAAQVPSEIKSRGFITVASDATYAPNEFIAPDGHTVIGMDADLVNALAEVMGLKAHIVNATFDTIIPGLAAGKYDMGASSFTDTKEREKTVDFVTYFQAGVSFYAKAGSNTGIKTLSDICGKTVSVEKGTTEQEEATEQSGKCAKEGKKPVTVLSYPTQNEANLAIASGRAQVGMADSPVAEYQVKQSNGQFELVGETYGTAPYGLAFPKGSGLVQPTLAALKELMANGTYLKILKKWGVEAGAITEPKINGATS